MEILGNHIEIKKGKLPKYLSEISDERFKYPYVDIKAFEKGDIKRYTDGEKCLICDKNDILIVWDGARCGLVGKAIKGAVGSTLAIIKPKENLDIEYMFYFLKSKFNTFNTLVKGIGIPHLNPQIIYNSELIIQNLKMQHRIVAKLEELFTQLDVAVAELKRAKVHIKTYKQSVLNKYLNDDIPANTEWKITGDIISTINNGYTPKSDKMYSGSGEVPFIKVYNLTFNGLLDFTKNPTFIDLSTHEKELKRSIALPNDILVNIVGPPLGKVSVVPNTYPEWNINQAIVLFRPNEKILSKFLSYYLQSQKIIQWLIGTSKATAGQYNVKVSTCREIPIPILTLEQQLNIVAEIEIRFSEAENLEKTIDLGLVHAESLRQSILKKAFEGRLVPQDPNDEPAEKLLERIKEEKETNNKKVKK